MRFDNVEAVNIKGSTFGFSAVRPENLVETEYTLVNLSVDISGSVHNFKNELLEMTKNVVRACKKSPRADNIILRLSTFDSNVQEVHGYVPVVQINPDDYLPFNTGGATALVDAVYSSVESVLNYASSLDDQDIFSNAINFIITDGMDNSSTMTTARLVDLIDTAITGEILDSCVNVLIGVNTQDQTVNSYLTQFQQNMNITSYVDVGDATPAKIAKLAGFISKSISSQSQSLGSGSAPIASLTF